ncbi:MAG: SEC-C metal-binding domain-containing protein, partial [bacterium]
LLGLLALGQSRDAAALAAQQSSLDEWREEARKLERQGKTEQVEAIRRSILRTEPVPWQVLTPATVEALADAARDPAAHPKTRRLLLDYAATYSVTPLLAELVTLKFKPAFHPEIARHEAQQRHGVDYHQRGYRELRRKIELHGVDFRNPLNQTPLMIATQLGLSPLAEQLVQDGAGVERCDNWGRIPLQLALRAAYQNPLYAKSALGALYPVLVPPALKVRVGDHLVKIDSHRMEFFLLHSMLALFEFILRSKIRTAVPAFETADFVHALAYFPESVIPLRRRRREAITSALAGNEVFRDAPGNRRLFVRVKRGFYIPNPCLALDLDGTWVGVRDLLHFDLLERESGNKNLAYFLLMVREVQREVDAFFQSMAKPVNTAPCAVLPLDALSDAGLAAGAVPLLPSTPPAEQASPESSKAPVAAPADVVAQASVLPAADASVKDPVDGSAIQTDRDSLLPPFAAADFLGQRSAASNPGLFDVAEPVRADAKVGRNDPCPCGSNRKFKKCCGLSAP